MLVTINPSVGSVSTDDKTRFFNFLASLHAVSTASAGSSPVVNPVNTSGVKNTDFNCITVISNTEAGGWTAGVSNNITSSTSYNASFSSPYLVDLYRSSGKSSVPWYRQLFGNYTYPFSNASFTSYPQSNIIQGSTNNNPESVIYSSATTWVSGGSSFVRSTTNWTVNPSVTLLNIASANTTYYVAVTENYLIITHPREMLYFGLRTVAPWELSSTANPPWCAFGFNGVNTNFLIINNSHSEHIYAFMGLLTSDNVLNTPVKIGAETSSTTGRSHAITRQTFVNSSSPTTFSLYYINTDVSSNGTLKSPFLLAYPTNSTNNAWLTEPPVLDPTTGLNVPPAYPIIFSATNSSGAACMGQLYGILKGMNQTPSGLTNYAGAAEYIVDGTPYQAVLTGNPTVPDLFLLRKA